VVLESSRPRALEQLGLIAADLVERGPQVWLSITGHGRAANRVAFGDDGAVSGGLVVRDDDGPCFCADAVADPLTGLAATAEVAEALQRGGRWLLDVPLAAVAASAAGPTLPASDHPVAPPRARPHPS
jgi:crotonobetainyl-CoA:carnitine CoA-transferase CaiB-like acyl-CoA transferase